MAEFNASRYYALLNKNAWGTITPEERTELDALRADSVAYYGWNPALPAPGAEEGGEGETPEPAPKAPTGTRGLLGIDTTGGSDEAADLDAQVAGAGEYASLSDWAAAMNTPQGKAQLATVTGLLSPTSALAKAVYGLVTGKKDPLGVTPGSYTGLGEEGGNTGWGYSIDPNTGAVTDAQSKQDIDYTSPGSSIEGGYGGGLDAGDTASGEGSVDATGSFGTGTDPSAEDWGYDPGDLSGGEGGSADSGSSADADAAADADMGFGDDSDWRHGGFTGLGRNDRLEPERKAGDVHEGEYVLRTEAVKEIGIPALDELNRMGRNSQNAGQSLEQGNGLMRDPGVRDSDMMPHEDKGMIEMFGSEGGERRLPALDQIRALSGPRPNGLAWRYDRRKGRVEQMGRM